MALNETDPKDLSMKASRLVSDPVSIPAPPPEGPLMRFILGAVNLIDPGPSGGGERFRRDFARKLEVTGS